VRQQLFKVGDASQQLFGGGFAGVVFAGVVHVGQAYGPSDPRAIPCH
jgi:hypothetical protein